MLAQIFGIGSLVLLLIWVFTTSKKRGYSTIESIGWGLILALIIATKHPLIMIGGMIVYSFISIKHQLKSGTPSPQKKSRLCSKCGFESTTPTDHCPKCDNRFSVT